MRSDRIFEAGGLEFLLLGVVYGRISIKLELSERLYRVKTGRESSEEVKVLKMQRAVELSSDSLLLIVPVVSSFRDNTGRCSVVMIDRDEREPNVHHHLVPFSTSGFHAR